jgi:hypothetical protein
MEKGSRIKCLDSNTHANTAESSYPQTKTFAPSAAKLTPLDLQDAPNAETPSKPDKFDVVVVGYRCKLTVLSVANLLSLGITAKTVTNLLALLAPNAKLCNRPWEGNA